VDVNKRGLGDTFCHTPLTAAIATYEDLLTKSEVIGYLVNECNGDVNVPAEGTKPWSPLIYAVEQQDLTLVKNLIKWGKFLDRSTKKQIAIDRLISFLGADVNYAHGDAGVVAQSTRTFEDEITAVYESNAATALFVACSLANPCDKNSEDIVAALLSAGAKQNHDQYKKGRCNTPLMAACYRGGF